VTSLRQGVEQEKTKFEERYSRQILFRGIGAEGQRQLAAGRVAIVGCGATGSALAQLLARAGVGQFADYRSRLCGGEQPAAAVAV